MSLEAFGKKRVLIVDPLENYRFSTKQMLVDLGMKSVNTASTAQAVISGMKNVSYDVILCNFDLSDNKNGQELLEELRFKKLLKFSSLFFIVTTEVARDKVLGTLENEPDGYLIKPLTPVELGKRLKSALSQKEVFSGIDQEVDEGNYKLAIDLCKQRLQEEDRYKLPLLKTLGWLYDKTSEYESAQHIYQSALERADVHWARYGLAKSFLNLEQYKDAESQLKYIIEQDPDRVEAYDLLASIKKLLNDPVAAQHILEQAIVHSPNSVLRQQALAEMRIRNDDQAGAIEAYRNVVKLGQQSIYAQPEQYYALADVLSKKSHSTGKSRLGKEALDIVGKTRKRFSDKDQIELQSMLVEAQVQTNMNNSEAATDIFEKVKEKAAIRKQPLNSETAIIAAETLVFMGRGEEVDAFLQETADKAADEGKNVGEIYNYIDKKINLKHRQKATDLNKKGIRLHQDGNLDGALKCIFKAIPYTPYHISLNLNLLQLLIKKIKANKADENLKEKALACLHRVRHIPNTHKEYNRYIYLKNQFDEIS